MSRAVWRTLWSPPPEGALLQVLGVLQEMFAPQSFAKRSVIGCIMWVIRLGARHADHFGAPR